mgnify:FL=1
MFRSGNCAGTVQCKNLVSLKYDGAIENASIVAIVDVVDVEREVRTATAPAVDAKIGDLALVATPEVVKDKSYNGLSDFINEDGTILRGYRLTSKDIFSVTKEAFESGSNLKKGDVVEMTGTGVKMKSSAAATGEVGSEPDKKTVTVIGKIVLVEGEWYVIEVA